MRRKLLKLVFQQFPFVLVLFPVMFSCPPLNFNCLWRTKKTLTGKKEWTKPCFSISVPLPHISAKGTEQSSLCVGVGTEKRNTARSALGFHGSWTVVPKALHQRCNCPMNHGNRADLGVVWLFPGHWLYLHQVLQHQAMLVGGGESIVRESHTTLLFLVVSWCPTAEA